MKPILKISLLLLLAILLLSFTKAIVKHKQGSFTGNEEPVETDSVARFTNQATTATLLKLIEQGKIKKEDKVFGQGNILGTEFGNQPYDGEVLQLTVNDLLLATANTQNEKKDGIIFTNPNMPAKELIGWSLDNLSLDKEAGTHVALAEFSFCVQGQLIEKITGTTYAQAIIK